MILTISKERLFKPEFNGNRKEAETDQVVVHYRTPTIAIKNRLTPRNDTKAITTKDGLIDHLEINLELNDNDMLKEMLINIDNLSYKDDSGVEVKIRNVTELNNAPLEFDSLRKEIITEFRKALNEADINEKN